MYLKLIQFTDKYIKILLSLLVSFCLIRVYEYVLIAHKSFINYAFFYEIAGLVYDIWAIAIYGLVVFIPVFVLWLSNKKMGIVFAHVLNAVVIITYISLLIVFSERNTPFDHEIYTRSFEESWATSKQMISSGLLVLLPFILFIALYLFVYYQWTQKLKISVLQLKIVGLFMFVAIVFIGYANPNEENFEQEKAYYFTANKFTYWINDTYYYFRNINQFNSDKH